MTKRKKKSDRVSHRHSRVDESWSWSGFALIVALVTVTVVQLVPIARRTVDTTQVKQFVGEGHDWSEVSIGLSNDRHINLGDSAGTLLLVFDPNCRHSDRIAGAWSEWLSTNEVWPVNVVAVSPSPLGVASAYASSQGWPLEVGSLNEATDSVEASVITRRTPWVFAVDNTGRVMSHGHGTQLDRVARSLLRGDMLD